MSHLDEEGAHDDTLRATRAFGDPRAVVVRWRVPPDCAGKTAAELLAHKVRRLGVERATSVVKSGDLRLVEGDTPSSSRALTVDERVVRGAWVELWRIAPDAVPDDAADAAAGVAPRILAPARDGGGGAAGVIVVDKPGDLAIHPSARYLHRTLTGWLRRQGLDVNPCHRLDRETSGVVICARGEDERRFKVAFQEGRVKKEYLAIVRATAALAVGARFTVDAPLALQGDRGLVRIRMVADDTGAAARTDFEVLAVSASSAPVRALLRCLPRTGRQHQIRAHLAIAGAPIVGDKLYAMGDEWFDKFTRRALSDDERAALDHPRQALHAARVKLDDEEWAAPFPEDLARLVR